ncbi:queuosine precursor transporter [Legionella fairfieldensis]|uniref:queuosine precursor transporter n=1 Tax=Legionella fairfieldensis TaxID=45064 RepID=UPI000490F459|nr:queuosine precursor transporter [Legionella fairfieldensis]
MNKFTANGKQQYKYLTLISMLYMTFKLTTILLIYKIINIGSISFTASTLVMPFWFFLGTIITETYGYRVSRHLIWMAIICQFIFAFICTTLIHVHSPIWVNQAAYDQILGKLPRVAFASFLAIMCGAFINAYVLAKYKILSKGKSFWLRGLKSSAIGELVFTIIAYLTEFVGIMPIHDLIKLMIISFLVKIVLSPLLILPCIKITKWLKKAEDIDIYDYKTNFNPFKLKLNDEIESYKQVKDTKNIINFPQNIHNNNISSHIPFSQSDHKELK